SILSAEPDRNSARMHTCAAPRGISDGARIGLWPNASRVGRTRPRTHTAFTMVRALFGARLAFPGECGKLFLGGGSTMQRSGMARIIRACSTGRMAVAAAALVVAGACGDTEFNTVFPVGVVVTVASASNNQTGVVGQALAQPIVVQVTDGAGAPVG